MHVCTLYCYMPIVLTKESEHALMKQTFQCGVEKEAVPVGPRLIPTIWRLDQERYRAVL